jgi:hypothetical protein
MQGRCESPLAGLQGPVADQRLTQLRTMKYLFGDLGIQEFGNS